jgi:hypothetical protein
MSTLCRAALLASLIAVSAAFATASHVEARQGFNSFFWSGPYYEPAPRAQRYYAPPRDQNYVPSRKKKVLRSEGRRSSKSSRHRAALAVPNEARDTLPPITCERAQAIVAEYGFKDVKMQICTEKNFEFRAMRDGKSFSIKIEANGELAKVQRLR